MNICRIMSLHLAHTCVGCFMKIKSWILRTKLPQWNLGIRIELRILLVSVCCVVLQPQNFFLLFVLCYTVTMTTDFEFLAIICIKEKQYFVGQWFWRSQLKLWNPDWFRFHTVVRGLVKMLPINYEVSLKILEGPFCSLPSG